MLVKYNFNRGKISNICKGIGPKLNKWTVKIQKIIGLKALEINVWILAVLREENRSYAPFHIFSSQPYKCQIIKNQS